MKLFIALFFALSTNLLAETKASDGGEIGQSCSLEDFQIQVIKKGLQQHTAHNALADLRIHLRELPQNDNPNDHFFGQWQGPHRFIWSYIENQTSPLHSPILSPFSKRLQNLPDQLQEIFFFFPAVSVDKSFWPSLLAGCHKTKKGPHSYRIDLVTQKGQEKVRISGLLQGDSQLSRWSIDQLEMKSAKSQFSKMKVSYLKIKNYPLSHNQAVFFPQEVMVHFYLGQVPSYELTLKTSRVQFIYNSHPKSEQDLKFITNSLQSGQQVLEETLTQLQEIIARPSPFFSEFAH